MQRKFLLNLLLIIFVNLMIKPLYLFGIDRSFQNIVGSFNYGIFYSLFNLTFILSVIIDPGITNFNNRHIAQNQHLLTKYFSNIAVIKLLLSVPFIIVIGIWGIFFANYSNYELEILAFLVISQIMNSYVLYNRSNLSGLHLFKTDTFISILDKLLMILLVGFFLISAKYQSMLDIRLFCILQSISFTITAIISFLIVKSYTHLPKFKFNFLVFRIIIKESFPYALLALLMVIYAKSDTVLLKSIHPNGNEEVGIYAAAYRLFDAASMIAVLFSGLLYPIFARLIKEKEELAPMIKSGFSLLVYPAITCSLVLFYFRIPIMELLYNQHAYQSAQLLGFLFGSFVASCITYICGTLLTANGNIKLLNKIAFVAVVLNLVLNYFFIPQYGSYASAIISCSTFTLVAIAHAYFSFKMFKLKIQGVTIIKFAFVVLSTIMVSILLKNSTLTFLFGLILAFIYAILILFTVRLIPLKEILTNLKSES